jgi:hypothetical protein
MPGGGRGLIPSGSSDLAAAARRCFFPGSEESEDEAMPRKPDRRTARKSAAAIFEAIERARAAAKPTSPGKISRSELAALHRRVTTRAPEKYDALPLQELARLLAHRRIDAREILKRALEAEDDNAVLKLALTGRTVDAVLRDAPQLIFSPRAQVALCLRLREERELRTQKALAQFDAASKLEARVFERARQIENGLVVGLEAAYDEVAAELNISAKTLHRRIESGLDEGRTPGILIGARSVRTARRRQAAKVLRTLGRSASARR